MHTPLMRLRTGSPDRFLLAGALLLMLAARLLPGEALFAGGSSAMLASHLLLELAVVVSMPVVVVAFFSLEDERSPLANSLIFAFTLVAGIDLAHALSYEGMPPFLETPNGMAKAAFFWLCGRAVELVAFALAVRRVRLPGGRWHWLLLGMAGSALMAWLGGRHLSLFPPLFLPDLGVTGFKAASDYLLCAGYLVLAWRLWRSGVGRGDSELVELARASCIMGSPSWPSPVTPVPANGRWCWGMSTRSSPTFSSFARSSSPRCDAPTSTCMRRSGSCC